MPPTTIYPVIIAYDCHHIWFTPRCALKEEDSFWMTLRLHSYDAAQIFRRLKKCPVPVEQAVLKSFPQTSPHVVHVSSLNFRRLLPVVSSSQQRRKRLEVSCYHGIWRQSWILDSRYWIPVFVSETWILDSSRYWDSGFLELYSGFQSPRIPDSISKKSTHSGFHKQKFP